MELEGPRGNAGEARIQNHIALCVSLRLHLQLAKQANKADPENFRLPTPTMRRVYGLQTGSGGCVWKLVVAQSNQSWRGVFGTDMPPWPTDEFEEVVVQDDLQGDSFVSDRNPCSTTHPYGRPIAHNIQTIYTLWSGNILDPGTLITFIDILHRIRNEVKERHDLIGNWLYCLRGDAENTRRSKASINVGTGEDHMTGGQQATPIPKRRKKTKPKRGSENEGKGGRGRQPLDDVEDALNSESDCGFSNGSNIYSWMSKIPSSKSSIGIASHMTLQCEFTTRTICLS